MKRPAEVRRVASVLVEEPGECVAGFPIGVVADLRGVTEQTLRLYASQGLLKPARRSRERFYYAGDVQRLECLRHLIQKDEVSIEGVPRLLHFAPCWEIVGSPEDLRCGQCAVLRDHSGGPVVNGGSRRGAPVQ